MNILALDIGTRHTGVAFADEENGIPLAQDTIDHETAEELAASVEKIINEKQVEHLVVGLPLLLSGEEGAQVRFVRSVGEILKEKDIGVTFIDERYTTPVRSENDENSAAACSLLTLYLRK
ncbi:MAG: Holliday junction resolvase RuvX [Patescibacteria group bacterium]